MEKSAFDLLWPEANRATRAALRRRGLSEEDVNDVLQLTAERALRSAAMFGTQEHFTRWCLRTSRHVTIDEWRRTRFEYVGDVPERRTADVADQVIARLDLAAVEKQIALLPAGQRDAILNFEAVTGDRLATFRVSSAKRLARQKLRRVIEGTAAAFGGRVGRLAHRLRQLSDSPAATAAVAGIAVALAFGGAVAQRQLDSGKARPRESAAPTLQSTAPANSASVPSFRRTERALNDAAAGPVSTSNGSALPRFSIPFGRAADGTAGSIEGGESAGPDEPVACLGQTLATKPMCVDVPIPAIDELLGLELI